MENQTGFCKSNTVKRIGNILIVQTAFAGDAVLTEPLVTAVMALYPRACVDVLLTPETAVLFKNHPAVRTVLAYDKQRSEKGAAAFLKWCCRLRQSRYDLALVPHRSIRSALLVFLAGVPRRVGFHRSAGWFLFTDVVQYSRRVHEVERNLDLIRRLGWRGCAPNPTLHPGSEEKSAVRRLLREQRIRPGQPLLAMAPGSVWPTKRWPAHRFGDVARTLYQRNGIRTVLIGGPADLGLAEVVRTRAGKAVADATGRFSLLESAEAIRRFGRLLANDSAPLHLASAVGAKTAAVFGPTVTAFGFGPFGGGHAVIQHRLECRPCAIHGGRKCPRGHFQCMLGITADEVAGTVLRTLFDRREPIREAVGAQAGPYSTLHKTHSA
ncbi:MAG TPA: glycosyltransferase family 9 protein [bacterium]